MTLIYDQNIKNTVEEITTISTAQFIRQSGLLFHYSEMYYELELAFTNTITF